MEINWRKLSRVNMKRYSLKPWRTLSVGPAGRRGERLQHYALRVQSNVRELAKQGVRLPDQVQGISSATSSGPELSGPHCHHDTGKQQLVTWRCEEGVGKRYADEFLRDPKEHDATRATENLCVTGKRSKCYVRGLCIDMAQYSSLCGCALGLILGGFDIVEADVQDREQVGSGEQEEAREREEDKTRTNNERSNM